MQTVRRLYLYLMSGVTLAVLGVGLAMLLRLLLEQLGLGPSGDVLGGDRSEGIRRELSVAIALVGVGTPVWLLHWWLVERGLQPERKGAEADRTSTVRALYLSVALGVLLTFGALAGAELMSGLLVRLLGQTTDLFDDPGSALATLVVTGAIWTYHAGIRRRDMRTGPMQSAAAWLPRAYLYFAALGGLVVLLTGIGSLVMAVADAVLTEPGITEPGAPDFGIVTLSDAVAQTLVGGAIWIGHWLYATRLTADDGWRGRSERAARLRLAFLVGAIAVGAIGTVAELSGAARTVLAALFGAVPEGGSPGDLARALVVPLAGAVPFGVAWWIHLRWLRTEAATSGESERVATADRLDLLAVALIGLGFGAVGIGWLLGLVIDVLLGGGRVIAGSDFWRVELSQFLPFAVVGSALWLWKWRLVTVRYARDPEREASSTARRAYLLAVLAASALSGLGSLGLVLYRLVSGLLGVDAGGSLASELSTPLGALIVATAVALYHGLALRRDQELRADAAPAEAAPEVTPVQRQLRLVLSGPPDADLAATLERLRGSLPEGHELDIG